ncbi:hypothetical protein ACWGE0_28030 [Lentzea sp. NPDC054927]
MAAIPIASPEERFSQASHSHHTPANTAAPDATVMIHFHVRGITPP